MKDERLEARNEKLNKNPCVNFSKSREEFRLTLRKKKLENYFENKRMKGYKDNIGDHSIEIESCNINEEIKLKMENLQENDKLEYIFSLLNSNSLDEIHYSLTVYRDSLIREKLSFNNKLFRRTCLIMQTYDNISIINECLWILINITFYNNDSFIFDVLTSTELTNFYISNIKHISLRENMIILISNLVGGNDKSRKVILSTDIYQEIIEMMKEENLLCIFKIHLEFLIILFQYSTREELKEYIFSKKEKFFETSWILSTIFLKMKDENIIISKTLECLIHFTYKFPVLDLNFINKEFIHELFQSIDYLKNNSALKIIGNLTSGQNIITFDLLKLDMLDYLQKLLIDENFMFKKDVIWIISNICCTTKCCLIQLIKSDILRDISNLFFKVDQPIKKEILNAFFNLSNFCDLDIANYLEHIGVFQIFKYFCENEGDPNEIQMALMGYFNLLELDDSDYFINQMNKLGVLDKLEKLSNHQNEYISKQVSVIFILFVRLKEKEFN